MSHHNVSISCGLFFDWAIATTQFFFLFFQSFCCRFAGVLDPFHNQALAVGHTVSYLTLELFDVQRNSRSSQWLQGVLVLWLQNKARSSALHHGCLMVGMKWLCWYAVLGFPQICDFAKQSHAAMLLLERWGFWQANPPKKQFNMLTGGCRFLDVALGFFAISLTLE